MDSFSYDVLNCIFSYVNVETLIQSMSVSKVFARTIDKTIKGATRNDILKHLFQIKMLSIETLRKYASQIIDHTQCAHLMLAACISGNTAFVSELIPLIIKNSYSDGWSKYLNGKFLKNTYYLENIFFNYIPIETVDRDLINFKYYFDQWLVTLLYMKQLNILDQMYSHRVNRCQIYDYIALIPIVTLAPKKDDMLRIIDNHIKKMIYDYDTDILTYETRWGTVTKLRTNEKINQFVAYALYGGHLDLFMERFQNQGKNIRRYHKLITICLLRCNHIKQYKTYTSTIITDHYYRIIDHHIRFENIFIDLPKIDNVTLPLISLETFEFCVQEFGLEAKIPRNKQWIKMASPEILNKYSVDNYISDINFICAHFSGNIDYNTGVTWAEYAIEKMIYYNEPDIAEYLIETECGKYNISQAQLHLFEYIALSGGHIELFTKIFGSWHSSYSMINFSKNICTCLLRYNHIDHYKKYCSALRFEQKIRIDDLFNKLKVNFELPRLSLTTFEFIVKEFDIQRLQVNRVNINDCSEELRLFLCQNNLILDWLTD